MKRRAYCSLIGHRSSTSLRLLRLVDSTFSQEIHDAPDSVRPEVGFNPKNSLFDTWAMGTRAESIRARFAQPRRRKYGGRTIDQTLPSATVLEPARAYTVDAA